MKTICRFLTGTCLVSALSACGSDAPPPDQPRGAGVSCDDPAVRSVVGQFGRRLADVSLLAPDSVLEAEMRNAYAPFVTARLLESWMADPSSAPGRQVSSPWPHRIEIRSAAADDGLCRVQGDVILVTSADTTTAAVREPVSMLLRDSAGWRISAFERIAAEGVIDRDTATSATGNSSPADSSADVVPPAPPASNTDASAAAAAAVIEQYYAAIDAGDYRRAWSLWSDAGGASGQSLEEFTAGFAETSSVRVETGEPGRIEGAAGSRFVTVPVTIHANGAAGAQTFVGTYTLRRSVVDGATSEQRSWRIHSAAIAPR